MQIYQMGAHFEALDESDLLVPLDPRYIPSQVGFNLISVQVCVLLQASKLENHILLYDEK